MSHPLVREVEIRGERQARATVRQSGLLFLLPAVLLNFTLLFLRSFVSYFILAVPMGKYSEEHLRMTSTFSIAILKEPALFALRKLIRSVR